jgi:hypothetical protein
MGRMRGEKLNLEKLKLLAEESISWNTNNTKHN